MMVGNLAPGFISHRLTPLKYNAMPRHNEIFSKMDQMFFKLQFLLFVPRNVCQVLLNMQSIRIAVSIPTSVGEELGVKRIKFSRRLDRKVILI